MARNQEVKNQLATKAKNQVAGGGSSNPPSPGQTIAAYLKRMGPELEKALPKHMDADRLARIALTTIRTNPALLECTVPSLMGATMQAAQLGLEPGLVGHCYFVPFNNKKKDPETGREFWQKEVQFIIGYKGMIDLARRSGHIQSIYAHAVYQEDEFEYELGLNPKLVHKPATGRRGEMVYVYAVAHFKDGGYQFEVFSKEDIENVRKRSKSKDNGPWKTDYEEMAKKTVIRRMWKYLPISIEIQEQAAADEVVRKDITAEPEPIEYIEGEAFEVSGENSETIDMPAEEEKPSVLAQEEINFD